MLVPISTTFLTGTVFLAFYTSVASASPAAVSPNHAGLLRREVPADSHCGNMEWMWRECLPNVSRQAYRDICHSAVYNQNLPVRAYCSWDSECFDILDWHLDKTIMCVPVLRKGEGDKETSVGGQAGSSGLKEGKITPSMSMSHQMKITDDIHGSLSAVLLCKLKVLIHIAIRADGNIIS
jgi:hypothetical protein